MELKISKEELSKRRLFVSTPMYGGMCYGTFAKSMIDLAVGCAKLNIDMMTHFLFNESLITRARNYAADEFIRSPCTHFLFLDSDIGFDPKNIIEMLILQSDESPYDVIGGPYAKKNICWEKIKMAVDKGLADGNPNDLEKYVGDYVFNPKSGTTQIKIDEPLEVLEIGTGHMMIRRATFEKFAATFPQYLYRPDHIRTEAFDGHRQIMQYYQAEIDPKSNRYLSEDYWFCQKVQEAGMKVWFCPWVPLTHTGTMVFGGSLVDILRLGANPTADPAILDKYKERNKK